MGEGKRAYSAEFKAAMVQRMMGGERVRVVQRETGVPVRCLYDWLTAYRREGVRGLRAPGKPRRGSGPLPSTPEEEAAQRIAELERKIGQQALEIDFLQRAFRRVKELGQGNGKAGATASTGRSAR